MFILIHKFLLIAQVHKAIFFYFLVYGSSDPNFCILEKKIKLFLTFFIFSDVKKCQFKKKKINIKKKIV